MIHYFTLPGLGGSDEIHWQSRFEKILPNCKRIEQQNWDSPDCETWIETVNNILNDYDLSKVVLICHSMGCITFSKWYQKYQRKVKGALLVAPPDLYSVPEEVGLGSFLPVPEQKIPFPTILVASENDRWSSFEASKQLAISWESEFIGIGKAGHINSDSGFGDWKEGQLILEDLIKKE